MKKFNSNRYLRRVAKKFYFNPVTIERLFFIWIVLILMFSGCNVISNVKKEEFIRSIAVPDPDLSTTSNGIYSGSYKLMLPSGAFAFFTEIAVDVYINANRYDKINIKTNMVKNDPSWLDFAKRIVDKQTLQIDGVTGATYATIAMKRAIVNAVTKGN